MPSSNASRPSRYSFLITIQDSKGKSVQYFSHGQAILGLSCMKLTSVDQMFRFRKYTEFLKPKLSDSSGRHEYRQHHPCHSESAAGGRRIFWVEPPSEILRRLSAPQNDSERRIAQFRFKQYLQRLRMIATVWYISRPPTVRMNEYRYGSKIGCNGSGIRMVDKSAARKEAKRNVSKRWG